MVALIKECSTNCVHVKQKPQNFPNKYQTIACCLSKTIFQTELVEIGIVYLKEGEFSKPELVSTITTITVICVCDRLTKPLWGSNWVCLLVSGTRYMETVPEFEKIEFRNIFPQEENHSQQETFAMYCYIMVSAAMLVVMFFYCLIPDIVVYYCGIVIVWTTTYLFDSYM